MRDYDPATGRYLQPDPLGLVDGASVYGYDGQSPMVNMDPTGARNPPGMIGNRPYNGNAFDRVQDRGIPPSAVENAILNGTPLPASGGATRYIDSVNGITAVVENVTGAVLTVW
jgi:uncharacterized protein RhaS with RHS repeats